MGLPNPRAGAETKSWVQVVLEGIPGSTVRGRKGTWDRSVTEWTAAMGNGDSVLWAVLRGTVGHLFQNYPHGVRKMDYLSTNPHSFSVGAVTGSFKSLALGSKGQGVEKVLGQRELQVRGELFTPDGP